MDERVAAPSEGNAGPGAGQTAGKAGRISQRGRTLRAFRTYLDLLDTAEHMRSELRGQLASYDLTVRGFRLLEMLYRDGPMLMMVAAKKLECRRQNVDALLARLEKRGWVVRELREQPPVKIDEKRLAKVNRGRERHGKLVGVVQLTAEGERFVGSVFPKHVKLVKSLMVALEGREQETLSRLLGKLRKGNDFKFLREIRMEEAEESGR